MSISESEYYRPNVFWIGTKNGGLNKYDRNTGSFTHYRHDPGNVNSLSSDFIFTLLESQFQGRNELWIGTSGGLDKFNLNTKKITCYQHVPGDPYSISNNIIRSIYEDKTGALWIGTRNGGLNKFDRTSGKFHRKKYYIGEALVIFEDNTGTFWAGTSGGLARYNSDTDDFIYYEHDPGDPYSLSHRSVLSIYEDKSSGLWIGTRDGLNLYNRETNNFTRYKVKDGLPSNVINGILEDDFANLWLSTNHGLTKFNPEQNTFRNYDLLDGLQSNQFMHNASCLSKKGEMFFGGVNGFNVFHPERIEDNPHIPDINLTDFKIFNKKVDVNTEVLRDHDGKLYLPKHISNISEIVLSYKESVFSFEFVALDYQSPQKNQYAYKMEGVDPDWVFTDASRRFASYTHLESGEYVFRVKGSNNDGLWNEEGASITIIITPPWWKTNLAYTLYVFLVGFIVFSIWRIQTNRFRMKHELELEQLHAKKLEEVDHMKSRFFTNISHEFRTPLTLIKGPLKQLLSGEFTGNIREQYKLMLRNSDRLLNLINEILDLSKLESGKMKLQVSKSDILQLVKRLVMSFSSLAESKNITVKFNTNERSILGYADRDKLDKIVTNLLSNAFKFTPEGGEIILDFELRNAESNKKKNYEYIQITISNTGPGIPIGQIDKIFGRFYQQDNNYKKDGEGTGIGLALTKELVEACHGEISVSSIPNKSTTFVVTLPISKECFKKDEIIEPPQTASPAQDDQLKVQIDISPSSIEDSRQKTSPSSRPVRIKSSKISQVSSIQKPVSSILIVEDNPDVTSYISSIMENDYQIITAENGSIGLNKASKKYPDLIVSDVMMPEMDGFELCKKLKSNELTSHIPVILLTAKADLESKIEGLEFGADDYISKPFEAEELKVRSKNLIDQRRKMREKFTNMIEINPGEITATSLDEQFLKRLMDVFENHVTDSDFNTEDFAREVGMSRSNLYLKVQALTNQSVNEFIRSLRLKRAAQLLRKNTGSVSEIAYEVGFNSVSHFSKVFSKQFGTSPGKFTKPDK